jgi:serine phosphatase RsbU (regulator of sigma subunit)
MLFLLLLMYSQFKIKRKLNIQLDLTNKNLVQKNSFIEKQKEKIINNITYAELIQKTIITNHQLPEYFPNSFVLFKPKALVSGDFYWCSKINDTIIVAVADCTGHGVPGAFMSIIGNMLLNQIVNEKKITTPSEILYQLNSAVYNILHQDDERSLSDDGMDIAICSINYSQKQLQFSGAQQPLYLMLNNTLQILKPSIYSIGGRRTLFRKKNPTAISYTNHTIEIENDMYIYLFSDGYTDQFGGPEEKKFSTPRFQNILLENQHISMAKQCELLASKHEQWKGSNQQTDDILVMGLKLTC